MRYNLESRIEVLAQSIENIEYKAYYSIKLALSKLVLIRNKINTRTY